MEKSVIHKLSDDIIRKLSFSTLIYSPSCVLKELIENSLDANSSSISVHIEDAGINLIRVIDNGIGIYKGDLHKVCSRFNTSKIATINDLNNIKTYGFRGESLFLINSVSRLNIFSKPYDQSMAYRATFLSNWTDFCIFSCACVNGTIIEVLDLFYNNLNFRLLLGDLDHEYYKLFSVFKIAALSNFNVHFVIFKNGMEVLNLPHCTNAFSKLKRIEMLNSGVSFDDVININFSDSKINFDGFIYLSGVKRYNKLCRYFFVNSRLVSLSIIDDIFYDILGLKNKKNFFFGYCLYLYLDVSFYNIIINYKKLDIMFRDYYFIYSLLYKIIYNEIFSRNKTSCSKNLNTDFVNDNNFISVKQGYVTESTQFFCMNFSNRAFYELNNSVLTILDNSDVFFRLYDKVYVVKLCIIRQRVIYNLCCKQFIKFGKILKKSVLCCELFDSDTFSVFLEFEDIILLYGLAFDVFNNRFLVVRSVPVLLYNLSVNWYALFYDLKVFLEKFSLSTFSRNRFDSNIVNIFIKHIEKKSVCNLYEVNLFYNELLNSRLNDVDWFDKNCNEVLIK